MYCHWTHLCETFLNLQQSHKTAVLDLNTKDARTASLQMMTLKSQWTQSNTVYFNLFIYSLLSSLFLKKYCSNPCIFGLEKPTGNWCSIISLKHKLSATVQCCWFVVVWLLVLFLPPPCSTLWAWWVVTGCWAFSITAVVWQPTHQEANRLVGLTSLPFSVVVPIYIKLSCQTWP